MSKILHMVQDSYSESHIVRNSKNEVIQIQDYTKQDEHKHGTSDAVNQDDKIIKTAGFNPFNASLKEVKLIPGVEEAIYASTYILTLYRDCSIDKLNEYTQYLENFLRKTVYRFGYKEGKENDGIFGSDRPAGGTHNDFKSE